MERNSVAESRHAVVGTGGVQCDGFDGLYIGSEAEAPGDD